MRAGGPGDLPPERRVRGGLPEVLQPSVVSDAAGRSFSRDNGTAGTDPSTSRDAWAAPRRCPLFPRGSQPGTSLWWSLFSLPSALVPLPPAPPRVARLLLCLRLRGRLRSGAGPPPAHPASGAAGEKACSLARWLPARQNLQRAAGCACALATNC